MMRLSYTDRALVAEHVRQLRDLAESHRQFAASIDGRSECSLSKAGAVSAGKRVKRLADLIEKATAA